VIVTREIAYHEAGHAVVALAFCATGLRASIKRRAGSAGRVVHGHLPNADDNKVLFITLAGPLAHRRFAPRSKWWFGGGGDFAMVEKLVFGGTAANKQKYLSSMVDRAEAIVDYFWNDIEAAAKALLKHETLSGDELAAVIRAARRKSRRRRRIGDPPAFALH
jgi:hypothetical protein